jgi:hypothetical protein
VWGCPAAQQPGYAIPTQTLSFIVDLLKTLQVLKITSTLLNRISTFGCWYASRLSTAVYHQWRAAFMHLPTRAKKIAE